MPGFSVQLLGSGDAFGSGGRFQTCFLLRTDRGLVLIDCGSSSLIAMKDAGVDPSDVGWILVSHLHGDHFGGIPFMVLDGQFSRRERPLVVAGPAGLEARLEAAMETMFPGSSRATRRFATEFVELAERVPTQVGPVAVTAFAVIHESGAPSFALRVECDGKVMAYSGDTEWTDALVEVAADADLFICEAYFFEKKVRYHMDFQTLRAHLPELRSRRIVLTHMSKSMLDRLPDIDMEAAEDGKEILI